MMEKPVVYTVKEVADILKVSTRTVKRMIKRGDIKAVKLGGTVRIRREALEEALEGE